MDIKHLQFVNLYLKKGYNATTAYMEVYECEYNTARVNSHKLLNKEEVVNLIEEVRDNIMQELGIDLHSQLKQLEFIKSKLIELGQYKDAVKPLEVQNDMLGLNAPIKTENTNINMEQPLFSEDDLDKNEKKGEDE